MPMHNFPQEVKKFEIQAYKKPKNISELYQTHAAFCGSPMKHPHDSQKIILVADPAGTSPFYYEFFMRDVDYMEEMPHITDTRGDTINMARVWLKKGSVGLRCIPFVAEPMGGGRPGARPGG